MMTVLVISNKADVTSDFIIKSLKNHAVDYYRLNTEDLFKSIQCNFNFENNIFELYDNSLNITIDLLKIKAVYYRRPELPIIDNDSLDKSEKSFVLNEYIFFLEGLYKILRHALWINPVDAVRNAENKIYQLQIAKEIGFDIPKSLISSVHNDCINFIKRQGNDCIVKPIKSGLIADNDGVDKVVFTNHINTTNLIESNLDNFPNYIQAHIHKKGDVRVTVVGNEVFSAFIDSQKERNAVVDWRSTSSSLEHKRIDLPNDIKERCIRITKRLGLIFSAIDLILDSHGNYIFLEINPNGQWAWIETRLGYRISDAITNVLTMRTKKQLLAKTSKFLYWIRELFIPILENDSEEVIKERERKRIEEIKNNCKDIADNIVDDALKLANQVYSDEENRRKNVESKSSIFISSLGLTISILTAIFLTVLKDFPKLTCEYPRWIIIAIIVCFIVLILYLCTTIFFAIRALERRRYGTLTSNEISTLISDDNFKEKTIETLLEYTERNYDVTNRKMDNMIMAHEYFKRSIIAVSIVALLIAITLIFA